MQPLMQLSTVIDLNVFQWSFTADCQPISQNLSTIAVLTALNPLAAIWPYSSMAKASWVIPI